MNSINLIPKVFMDQQRGELRGRLMIRLSRALMIVIASIWLPFVITYIFFQGLETDSSTPDSQEIIKLAQRVEIAEDELRHVRSRVETRIERTREKLAMIGVIDAVACAVPAGITLGTVRISRGGISLKGVARDRGAVSEMVDRIGSSLNGTSIIIENLSDVVVGRDVYQEFLVSQQPRK